AIDGARATSRRSSEFPSSAAPDAPAAHRRRARADVTLKGRGEMAMAREAKVEREAADVRLPGFEAGQRRAHANSQNVLMDRQTAVRPEHVRQVKGRDTERDCEIPNAVWRPGRGVD